MSFVRAVATAMVATTLVLAAGCGGGGGGGGSTQATAEPAKPADSRNGSYKVYSSSGARFDLALNFDQKTYAFTGSNNGDPDASGSFSEVVNEPGSYVFQSTRVTTVANTARFRLNADTVVGAFPFSLMHKTPVVYSIRPFFATRALIRTQASLDGIYNRFGIGLNSQTDDTSQITQVRISDGGTKLVVCTHNIIYPIAICPSTITYTVTAGSTPDTWQMTDGNGSNVGSFGVAPLADGKVYLAAGRPDSASPDAIFRIGVSDKPTWQLGAGHGSATPGSWGTINITSQTASTRTGITVDGSAVQATNTFYPMYVPDPITNAAIPGVQGMRELPGNNAAYFAMQGAGLFAIVGANNVAQGTNGHLQLNMMD